MFTPTSLGLIVAGTVARTEAGQSASITPHDMFSSSVGVLGCHINTNRVAYWPPAVDCTNICVKVSYQDREVYLLRIDQSGGAHDISYDAWNYLVTGQSALTQPTMGGGVDMEWEDVPMSDPECAKLITTPSGNLPIAAANGMNYVVQCIGQAGSWVGSHYELRNLATQTCSWGVDEICTLDPANINVPATCPTSILGIMTATDKSTWVKNIAYGTGVETIAPQ
jgi:hypothetical protein